MNTVQNSMSETDLSVDSDGLLTIEGGVPHEIEQVDGGDEGPAPRYGTCTMSTPASILNSSPAMWGPVPVPGDAMLSLRGLSLAYAINSGTDLARTDGFTTIP